jgi:hypothetical protein
LAGDIFKALETDLKLVKVQAEVCAYRMTHAVGDFDMLLVIHVDDILFATTNVTKFKLWAERLDKKFKLSKLERVKDYLGLNINMRKNGGGG